MGVAVIDAAVQLFGQLFPRVNQRHRTQTLDHFAECVRAARSSRQEAVQLNMFAALLCGLRSLAAAKVCPFHRLIITIRPLLSQFSMRRYER